jgi:hypothetical protein
MTYPSQSIPLLLGFAVFIFGGQSIETENWGEPVEGVQCGLRLAGKSSEGAVPLLLVDVRNTASLSFLCARPKKLRLSCSRKSTD